MKTDFHFSNLLGTVYCKGNILYTPDGSCLLSPVGNRITVFDLINNKSHTLPFAHRQNIAQIALAPKGNLLLSVDESGQSILSNLQRRVALYHFSFKSRVSALKFSPSGRHIAAGVGRFIEIWHTPSGPDVTSEEALEFAPFVRHRVLAGHNDDIYNIEWSSDSRFLLSSSKDLTSRIWSTNAEEGFVPTTLAGHREGVLGAWFTQDQESIFTVSRDGALCQWEYVPRPNLGNDHLDEEPEDENFRWRVTQRHYFMQNNAKVTCATFHPSSNLLVAGFSNGLFALYELPDFNMIHTLSISQNTIDHVAINASGEWLAFGASKLGQLLVWEWQSESYILKQQGHFDAINALTYSPDGHQVITTSEDGKIKVWDVQSGFCVVTFTEHSAAVTACAFAKRGKVLYTASLDGSIRAWDLIRYRNFRTFTAPTRLAFSCIAVDPSGEVICAGSLDSFDVHLWSVQTGQLLDQLAGHEGPVSALAFAPNSSAVVSGSWDHTVRIWNVFGRTQTSEPLQLQADVLDLAIRPDSKQIAVSTLDGQLTFWSLSEADQQAGIDSRRDVSGGRKVTDRQTAANAAGSKAYYSIGYSVDGSCVLAGGRSKYICLYDVQSGALVKKFTVSVNLSLEGTQEFLNSKKLSEAGPVGMIDTDGEALDLQDRLDHRLPGATRGKMASRNTPPEVRVTSNRFNPTGRSFCAATTEGLLMYSLDTSFQFDPFDLDISITPATIVETLKSGDVLLALIMAFRLNDRSLVREVYEATPISDIKLVTRSLPTVYLPRLLRFLAQAAEETPHLEFNLLWTESLFSQHGQYLRDSSALFEAELRAVQKAITRVQSDLSRLADDNQYVLDYYLSQASRKDDQVDGVDAKKTKLLANGGLPTNGVGNDGSTSDMEEEGGWIGFDDV
ncbi:hypothetical protein MMC25_006221 [Agyrium rufum]|nr:hypothetical protein [Agyrium rufum]